MFTYYTTIEIPVIFLGFVLCMICCSNRKPKPEEEETLDQDQCTSVFIIPVFEGEGSDEAGPVGRLPVQDLPAYTPQDRHPPPSYWQDSQLYSEAPPPYTSSTPHTQTGTHSDDIINTRHSPYVPQS